MPRTAKTRKSTKNHRSIGPRPLLAPVAADWCGESWCGLLEISAIPFTLLKLLFLEIIAGSGCRLALRLRSRFFSYFCALPRHVAPMNDRKHAGHEEQSRERGNDQAADNGPAERGILLAAFAES